MNRRKVTGILCTLTLAGSALAAGQNAESPAKSSTRSSTYNPSSTSSSRLQAMNPLRASQIIGSTVKAMDGKTLGQVRDIVVDPQAGRIDFAVLSLAGSAETSATSSAISTPPTTTPLPSSTTYNASASGKLVPVPWQLFAQNFASASTATSSSVGTGGLMGQTMNLTLNLDEAKLRSAPSFEANNWSTLQGGDFAQRAYAYYGLDWSNRATSATGTPGAGVSSGIGTSSPERSSDTSTIPNQQGTLPDRSTDLKSGTVPK